MKSNKFLMTLWDYFLMTVGSLIFCMAWTSIIIPTGLTSGGLATNYILDNWKEGDSVEVSAPLGTFKYEPLRDAKTVVGLAGGSDLLLAFR